MTTPEQRQQWEDAEEVTRRIWDRMCYRENAKPDDPMFRDCPDLFIKLNGAVRYLKLTLPPEGADD